MAKAAKAKGNEPWVSNYPTLQEWLDAHDARRMHQERFGTSSIETWIINAHVFVVMVYANGCGWNLFTDSDDPNTQKTFADAEARLKITKKDATLLQNRKP